MSDSIYDTIIIGSGPAGYTAALYSKRAGNKTLFIAGYEQIGGALTTTDIIENFPSHTSISGTKLMELMQEQLEELEVETEFDQVIEVELESLIKTVKTGEETYKAKSVILSTGSAHRKLNVEGEEEYSNNGVSYCATCDGFFFKDKSVVVVGGGDSAFTEALYLSNIASQVTIIHRRDEFKASQILIDRVKNTDNINILTNYQVNKILGDGKNVNKIEISGTVTNDIQYLDTEAVFIAIGLNPRNTLFNNVIKLDDNGYVITEGKTTRTNIQGVFAAGDLADPAYQQAITAAGSGCKAALDANDYLQTL